MWWLRRLLASEWWLRWLCSLAAGPERSLGALSRGPRRLLRVVWSDSLPLPPDLESPAFGSFSFLRSLPLRLEPLLRLPARGQGRHKGRSEPERSPGTLRGPPPWSQLLTFTVLTAGTAPAVAVAQFWEARVRVVGVWGWWVLVRESHGPRGGPRMWQGGQRVLI